MSGLPTVPAVTRWPGPAKNNFQLPNILTFPELLYLVISLFLLSCGHQDLDQGNEHQVNDFVLSGFCKMTSSAEKDLNLVQNWKSCSVTWIKD